VRHVSQLHFNQLFSNDKVSIKIIYFSPISMDFLPLILYPCYRSLGYCLSRQMLILQMANTRNRNNNHNCNGDNNGENNQNVDPASPPPSTLEQVLAMQEQMLQTMQQTMVNMQAAQPQAPPPPRVIGLDIFSALSHLPYFMLWS
jgi:hypothetical protein